MQFKMLSFSGIALIAPVLVVVREPAAFEKRISSRNSSALYSVISLLFDIKLYSIAPQKESPAPVVSTVFTL